MPFWCSYMYVCSPNAAPKYKSMSSSTAQLKKQSFVSTVETKWTVLNLLRGSMSFFMRVSSWAIIQSNPNSTWLTSSFNCLDPNPQVRCDFPTVTLEREKLGSWRDIELVELTASYDGLTWAPEVRRVKTDEQGSGLTKGPNPHLLSPNITKNWKLSFYTPDFWTLWWPPGFSLGEQYWENYAVNPWLLSLCLYSDRFRFKETWKTDQIEKLLTRFLQWLKGGCGIPRN